MKNIKDYFENIQNINEKDILDLCKSKSGIYKVKREGVNFFFYFNPSNKKQLYCFFSGGGRSNSEITFHRWSWADICDGAFICFEDPMYQTFKIQGHGYFYGSKTRSFLMDIKSIVANICLTNGLDNNQLTFVGSSVGGYAALTLTHHFPGSKCIAFNPQFDIVKFGCPFFSNENIFELNDLFKRANILENTIDSKSKRFISFNLASPKDKEQLSLLENYLGRVFNQGVNTISNNILYLYDIVARDKHNVFPDKALFPYIERWLSSDNLGLNDFYSLFTSYLREVYSLSDRIYYLSCFTRILRGIDTAGLILPSETSMQKNYICLKLDGIDSRIHYEIQIHRNSSNIVICFHCENKDLFGSTMDLFFSNLSNITSYSYKKTDNAYALFKKADEKTCKVEFNELKRKTFNIIKDRFL